MLTCTQGCSLTQPRPTGEASLEWACGCFSKILYQCAHKWTTEPHPGFAQFQATKSAALDENNPCLLEEG